MRGTLIALAAIPISAALWGLFTGRWTAESRRVLPSTIPSAQLTSTLRIAGLVLAGAGVVGVELWLVIVLPLLVAYVNFVVIPVEERSLPGVFGESYQQYRAKVRRWL